MATFSNRLAFRWLIVSIPVISVLCALLLLLAYGNTTGWTLDGLLPFVPRLLLISFFVGLSVSWYVLVPLEYRRLAMNVSLALVWFFSSLAMVRWFQECEEMGCLAVIFGGFPFLLLCVLTPATVFILLDNFALNEVTRAQGR